MSLKTPRPGTLPHIAKALQYQSLVLEAILAELRYLRGLNAEEMSFLQSDHADAFLRLDEFQAARRDLFREV